MNSREEEVARRERKLEEFTRGHRQHVASLMKYHHGKRMCELKKKCRSSLTYQLEALRDHTPSILQYLLHLLVHSGALGVLII